MLMHFVLLLLAALIYASTQPRLVNSHEEKGEWSCDSRSDVRVNAELRPGIVTLDGHAHDWKNIHGFEFPLLIAVDPDPESEYNGGKMTVKALHDGHDVFFLLQVDGEYAYSKGKNTECPSVALMFQIGENASYHRSGNSSSGQNDWRGAWWHISFTVHSGFVEEDSPYADANKKGTYYFEFSRPLRTMDHLQQDAQFTIGKSINFSVAFWYPENTKPWHGSGHYCINCDWIPLDVVSGSTGAPKEAQRSSWNTATVFSFLVSLAAFSTSILVGY
ncbi:uncharacterized protein LOC141701958 [Apium graveolens]|uniref:uncharacterized protein LOC141701958 n=1 Tax=Apium graveolens TaxID=4045 RepID=UPI003D7BADF3